MRVKALVARCRRTVLVLLEEDPRQIVAHLSWCVEWLVKWVLVEGAFGTWVCIKILDDYNFLFF